MCVLFYYSTVLFFLEFDLYFVLSLNLTVGRHFSFNLLLGLGINGFNGSIDKIFVGNSNRNDGPGHIH